MTLFVDADGCPVVSQSIRAASEFRIPCVLLCDTSHRMERPGATTITVSKGADSVDFALVNMVKSGDAVVTQDYGLAAMCMAKNAHPIHQDGMRYTEGNIDQLLLARHTARKIRMAGGRLRGPKKREPSQDAAFESALRALLAELTQAKPDHP